MDDDGLMVIGWLMDVLNQFIGVKHPMVRFMVNMLLVHGEFMLIMDDERIIFDE